MSMFYTFDGELRECGDGEIPEGALSTGYVKSGELQKLYPSLGFAPSTAEDCRNVNMNFRSGVEVYDDYTFTELRIVDPAAGEERDDCVALYIRKDLFLVVDVLDADSSTENKYRQALRRFPARSMTLEKLIYAFLDSLVARDVASLEAWGREIAALEEQVLRDEAGRDFNLTLLRWKSRFLSMRNYYEQLLDITEALEEDENDLFPGDSLMYISNLGKKIVRLREDVDALRSTAEHLQDAYSSYLDFKMNQTMKLFTVITSIFFPLTIIVGWYGMNFQSMPEFAWRYGYVYVIALSIFVVASFILIGRRKKWF